MIDFQTIIESLKDFLLSRTKKLSRTSTIRFESLIKAVYLPLRFF